jgi:hypothetical protein
MIMLMWRASALLMLGGAIALLITSFIPNH